MRSQISKIAVLAISIVGVSSVLAGCRHRGHRHDPAKMQKFATWFVDDALDDLDATDAQRQAIHASKDRLLAEGLALKTDGKKSHMEVYREWQKDEPDVQRVHALIDERVEAFRIVAHKAADEVLAAHALLTAEQRAEVSERIQEHLEDH